MLVLLLLLSVLQVSAVGYRKTRPKDVDLSQNFELTEEDISLQHQVIQWKEKLTDVWSEYYSIPWELLNPQDLSEMGLSEFSQFGTYADLKTLGPVFTMNLPINKEGLFIPKNTSLLFLFNTSTAYNSPGEAVTNKIRDHSKVEPFEVIQASLPFGLPAFHYVADYSLLIPKPLLDRQMNIVPFQSASHWIKHIGLRRIAIPLSRDMINENELVLAFVFRSAKRLEDFVSEEELVAFTQQKEDLTGARGKSYRKAKTYIDESLLLSQSEVAKAVISSSSGFFDSFARKWVTSVGYESLLYSTFCQVNCRYHEQNYCLKFRKGQHATVSLLTIPADELNRPGIHKRSIRDTLEDFDSKTSDTIAKIKEFMEGVKAASFEYGQISEYNSSNGREVSNNALDLRPLKKRSVPLTQKPFTLPPTVQASQFSFKHQLQHKVKRALIDLSFVDKKFVTSENNCVQITWKRIFEHAFFGTNANFCTRAQTLEQLKRKEESS